VVRSDNDNLPLAAQGTGNGQPLTFFSVCSGIEAASVAWPNWHAVGFAEIDKAAARLLAYRYPHVHNYGDFTTIDVKALPRVDILCGGTPCQAFSVAGARRGLDDARGNLSLAFVGLAHELADNNGLRNAVWENVPGVLTMADNAFGCFLAGLVGADGPFVPVERKPRDGKSTRWWRWAAKEKCHAPKWPRRGMVSGPKGRAAWHFKDAQYFGLAQRRERVLVVADFGNGADPSEVLFERVGVPWHPPARGEKREGVAGTIAGGARASGGYSHDDVPLTATAFGDNNTAGPIDVATARNACHTATGRLDFESETFLVEPVCVTVPVTHTLTTEGADASEDGTGRGTPIVAFNPRATDVPVYGEQTGALDACYPGPAICFTAKDYGADAQTELAPTLRAGGHKDSHQNGGVGPAVTVALRGREGGATAELGGEVATALRASQGGGDKPHVLTSAVRRLTPRECERLQGFPDDYTRIPVKWYATKKVTKNRPEDMWEPAEDGGWWLMQADGPRYKQLGNSWAVPKFTWLGKRIEACMPVIAATNDNKEPRHAAAA
jgi:DNA (cytosine-5)-methyltransferase 1